VECLIKKLEKGTEDVDARVGPINAAYSTLCDLDPANTDDDEYLANVETEVNRANLGGLACPATVRRGP